ncbi:hypothetical protein D9613_008914 [Agrocybe pediades]|uniref:Uncharacterized protein n=1 Tax=Agrocybe pediades TaxID=84607 RepID=A0A8H4VN76_9AGAR|nr:hypothetical protein D9613_008914 [Agrocybe pediades]
MIPPLTLHPSASSQHNIMHRVSDPYSTQLRRKLRPLLPKPQPASVVHPSSIHSHLLEANISLPLVASIHDRFSGTKSHQHRNLPIGARTRPIGISTPSNFLPSPSHHAPVQSAITRQRNHPYRRPIVTADTHSNPDTALAQPAQSSASILAIHSTSEEKYQSHTNPSSAASSSSPYPSSSASISTIDASSCLSQPASPYPTPSNVDPWMAQWKSGIDPNASFLQTTLRPVYHYPNLYPVSSSLDAALVAMVESDPKLFESEPDLFRSASSSPSSRIHTEQLLSNPPSQMAQYVPDLASSYHGSPLSQPDSPGSSTSTDPLSTPPPIVSDIAVAVVSGNMISGEYPSGAHELSPLSSELEVHEKPRAAAPIISKPVVIPNQSHPQDRLVRNKTVISGQGQVSPERSPCPKAVEPNQANNPAQHSQSGGGDEISSSKKRKREAITTKTSLSFTPEARKPSQRKPLPPCQFFILQEYSYNGEGGKFKRSIPGAEGGMMKTPEDYQTGNASWQTPNPKRRRVS